MSDGAGRHALGTVLRHPIIAAVLAGLILAAVLGGGRSNTPSSQSSSIPTSPTNTKSTPTLPQPSATQLQAVLVPASAYHRLLPDFYDLLDQDSDSYALQGGIPALKLCNSALPTSDLGPDSASAYVSVPVGARPNIYYGSDAASFTANGATQFLAAAAQQAPTCGWRSLPGPPLGSQTIRLTMDVQSPGGDTLYGDVILVRAGSAVAEIATATVSGSHSADAEGLAEGVAKRLTLAERTAAGR